MVKFIDCAKDYTVFEDEILARCTCGCEIISFSFGKFAIKEREVENLSISIMMPQFKKTVKKDLKTYVMMFPSDDSIKLIYQILKGEINEGAGCVASLNGSLFGMQRIDDEENNGNSILMCGFRDEKTFIKYNKAKTEDDAAKYVAWEIYLDKKGYETFMKHFEKIFYKRFPNFKEEQKDEVSDNK